MEDALSVGLAYTKATTSKGVSFEDSQWNYTDWAPQYDEILALVKRTPQTKVADYVCSSFEKDDYADVKILDVGAGTGLVGLELKRRGFVQIDALEPNEAMLNKARTQSVYENYFFEYIRTEQSSFEADSYDVVTGCGIFAESAHVPCEALKEMIRIVKPGGYIVLAARRSVLERDGEASNLESKMEELEQDGMWETLVRECLTYVETTKQPGIIWKFQVPKTKK